MAGAGTVVGIAGSGRKNANSARLLAEALAGAERAGLGSPKVYELAEMVFRGCVGCRACRRDASSCVLRDDLTEALQATASATALVLTTPIYYGYTTGLFKSYLDRWYAFRDKDRHLRVPEGRPALLILTQGNPEPQAYAWTLQSLEKVVSSYGFRVTAMVGAGLEGREDVLRSPELLARAGALGASLGTARP